MKTAELSSVPTGQVLARPRSVAVRLRIAFFGAAAFSILAAIIGWIGFSAVERAQREITDVSVPILIDTEALLAESAQILSLASTLVAVSDLNELETQRRQLRESATELRGILAAFPRHGFVTEDIALLDRLLNELIANLTQQAELVEQRLEKVRRRREAREALLAAIDDILRQLRPMMLDASTRLTDSFDKLRDALDATTTAVPVIRDLDALAEQSVYSLQRLDEMRLRTQTIREIVDRLPLERRVEDVREQGRQFGLHLRALTELALSLPPRADRQRIGKSLQTIVDLAYGPRDPLTYEEDVLVLTSEIEAIYPASLALSDEIRHATAAFAAAGRVTINAAAEEARSTVQGSRLALVIVAVVAFGVCVAGVWFFVTKDVVARLKTLSNIVRRLSAGDLDVSVDVVGNDELTDMARALEQSRDNARSLRQSQEALRQKQEEQQLIFDNVPVRIWYKDDQNRILRLNRQAADSMGLTVAEAEGADTYDLFPEMAAKYHADDLDVVNSGHAKLGIVEEYTPKSGARGWVRTDKVPYVDDRTGETRLLIAATDISELKEAETRLEHLIGELRRSNSELEQFAYVASHDLKAPLRGIDNLASWIAEDLEPHMDEDCRDNMRLLRGRIARLERLLEDLLQYSRAGRAAEDISSVDCGILLQDVFDLTPHSADFQLVLDGRMPVFETVKAPFQLVMRNLIGNAIKHHDRDKGVVSVSVEDLGDQYAFTVADDGAGVPAAYHDRVFGMFQTLKARDDVEGSGMGLAIIKKLVDAAGGEITLDSDPERRRGAVFRFTWPKRWPRSGLDGVAAE